MDSEEEWNEANGEDIDNDDVEDDDEKMAEDEDNDDGFMVPDGYLSQSEIGDSQGYSN